MKNLLLLLGLVCSLSLLNGCGGSSAVVTPPAAPTVTLSASSDQIQVGESVTLTWSSTNATSCAASATPSQSDWSGSQPTSGSQSVTPAAPGTITYTLQCSGTGGNASKSAGVTANPAPLQITSGAPPSGTVASLYFRRQHCFHDIRTGQYYCEQVDGYALNASGGAAPFSWNWAAAPGSALPPGLDIAQRVYHTCYDSHYHRFSCPVVFTAIAGTPTFAGSYNVVVTVTDSASPPAQASANYTIVINNPPPPVINTSPRPAVGAINLPYSFTFTASQGYPPLTWSETGALPPGLNFTSDGLLSGTPTATGSFPISVKVQDQFSQSDIQDFTIEVVEHGFKATGSMEFSRQRFPATLLADGRVLVSGGAADSPASAELFDPATGTFSRTTNDMTAARTLHTATRLNDGRVLLTGGFDPVNGIMLDTAEIFDPSTGAFTATSGKMTAPRELHWATQLDDGTVLITGGLDSGGEPLATAEIFDPATEKFTSTGSMGTARVNFALTKLKDGRVLVTGGFSQEALSSAELFDPSSKTFAPTGSMSTTRVDHTATLLNDGKVLAAGGSGDTSAELFDPASGTFVATGNMVDVRSSHTATLLNDGTVLVAGGFSDTGLFSAEVFDPVSGTFSETGSMTAGRYYHAAVLLNDGTALVVGGTGAHDLASTELYQ